MTASKPRLGDSLTQAGLVTQPQVAEALTTQRQTGELLGEALVNLGYLSETDLVRTLCSDAGIPYMAGELAPHPDALATIPEQLARVHLALPLRLEGRQLVIAAADPFDLRMIRILEQTAGRSVSPVGANRVSIEIGLDRAYGTARSIAPSAGEGVRSLPSAGQPRGTGAGPAGRTLAPPLTGAPRARDAAGASGGAATFGARSGSAGVAHAATELTFPAGGADALAAIEHGSSGAGIGANAAETADRMIQMGIDLGATDIHIEPQPDALQVRYRIDGMLQDGPRYSKDLQAPLMSRIKILAGIDIAESRLPQDGRVRTHAQGRPIDLRVSTFPTVNGEDTVLRILDRGRVALSLSGLGICDEDVGLFREAVAKPFGLIAVTGPTGSGKTTTLYAALLEMNTGGQCIITLEDPVEYEIEGIRQSQINVRAGLTFASGLRAMLRHDPDVILVGEMRDAETVQIAMSAALTGHLVLTTLHTTTAAGAFPRLLDMKAEPYVVASAVRLVVSQRLVRALCPECKKETNVPANVREYYHLADTPVFGPGGCAACRGTGYRGRVGIFEFLPMTDALASAVYEHRSADEIRVLSGRPTLIDDGLRKVRAGVTTLDEVLRVVA